MREVWKFAVTPDHGWQDVMMPRGAVPVHWVSRYMAGDLWAIVDPSAPLERQRVAVIGTGWSIPEGAKHVHTHICSNSGYVWHLFVPEAP